MTFWHQARLAVTRRQIKSLILALIITLISGIFVLQGVITSTLNALTHAAEEQIPPGFTLTSSSGDFRQEAATPLLATPHVVGHHFTLVTSCESADDGLLPVMGTSDPARLSSFEKKEVELTDGTHDAFTQLRESRGAIVEELMAQQRNLKVGSQFTLTKNDTSVTVTVVGLYKSNTQASSAGDPPIYTDLHTAQQLAGKEALTSASYFTDSRAHVDEAMTQVKTNLVEGLTLCNNTLSVADILDSVTGLTTLITRLLWAVLVAGGAILILVLVFWTRSRIHEVGVLMSIGYPKRRLFAQFTAELMILTVPSFILAVLLGETIGYFISRHVITSVSASIVGGIDISVGTLIISVALACVAVMLLVLVSLLIAMTPILRLRPKQILAKMS